MEQSKKKLLINVLVIMIIIGTTFGISIAFFNYTRTGPANTVSVGRIYFSMNQSNTINLTNLFPIDPTVTGIMNDNTKVGTLTIEIEGDTDYSDGIEYLVSSVNSSITTSTGKVVPISLDVTVSSGLGTSNANYFTARENTNASIYKKLVGGTLVGDQMLLVGFIKPNTTSGTIEGIDGSITIKAYLDKNNILISDTYDGTESDNMGTLNSEAEGKTVLTTTEWNALQNSGLSFKVKVEAREGIWVGQPLDDIIRVKNINATTGNPIKDNENSDYVVNTTPGINFGAISGDTNGKGIYMMASTQNDAYPIMYYRGAVEDNNVLFANQCWKAVRTTDTGGVKLIYNGELSPVINREYASPDTYATAHEGDMWTFDATDSTWNFEVNDGQDHEISFKVPSGNNYSIVLSGTSGSTCGSAFQIWKNGSIVYNNGLGGGNGVNYTHSYGTLTSSDELKFSMTGASTTSSSCSVNMKINMQQGTTKLSKNDYSMLVESDSGEYGCDNTGSASDMTLNISGTDTSSFRFSGENLNTSPAYNGYMYGTTYAYDSLNWTSGAKFGSSFTWDGTNYKLVDASVTTPNPTHHYSCNQSDANATCTNLRYVYFTNASTKYYIILTGGDGVEQALAKMQTNTNDSNAKDKIDAWFETNLTNIVDNTKKDYRPYLEDTIWCNDRSFGDNNNNGWIANGGKLTTALYYGAFQRSNSATYVSTVRNQPSLACANKNDRFTVNNGNGNMALDYPIALLTEDEIVLAGGVAGVSNGTYYLANTSYYWTLSPSSFAPNSPFGFGLYDDGSLYNNILVSGYLNLRPSISIKPGTPVVSGTGTVLDPYVIE